MKNKKLLSIVFAALTVVFIVLGVLGIAINGPQEPTDVRDGVVYIEATYNDENGNLNGGSGTGWGIGAPGQKVEYIVTNGHVVKEAYMYGGRISVFYSAAENDFVMAKVVYYSAPEDKDIAILQLPSPTSKRKTLSLRASDTVDMGEQAYALGYPGIASERQQMTVFDTNDITVTSGVISKRTNVTGVGYEVFQTNVDWAGGNSGGPVVDKDGYVLGIATLTALDVNTGASLDMHYAIIIDELRDILDDEGIAYTMNNTYSWMTFVFFPLAAICAVLLILTVKKGGFVLVKANGSAKPASGTAGGASAQKKPVLRGVAGLYSGQTFELKNRVVLGRDKTACEIVFPADTPGVSGKHCSVYYDQANMKFILTDLGSSYGTFLGNGQKIPSEVATKLSSGDMFYLADGANKFLVSLD